MVSNIEYPKGRSPRDGKPYYCAKCGMGYEEFIACELESDEQTQKRANNRHYSL